jgi:hypothetical protein
MGADQETETIKKGHLTGGLFCSNTVLTELLL